MFMLKRIEVEVEYLFNSKYIGVFSDIWMGYQWTFTKTSIN